MKIGPLKVEHNENGSRTCASSLIEWEGGHHNLSFSVNNDFADGIVQDRLDAFVVCAIFRAMHEGEDVEVHGCMSAKLHYNLKHYWMPLVQGLWPHLKIVNIDAEQLTTSAPRASGVATGYSAGIDSFAVLYDHLYNEPPAGYRLTHFLFNNVGSHGGHTDHTELFQARLAEIRPLADRKGIPIIDVDSNLGDLIPLSFENTHPARNAAVPLLLQGIIGRWYYASSYHYADHDIPNAVELCDLDPVMVHLYSTEQLDCILSGAQYTRVKKTQLVSTLPDSYSLLNVCAGGDRALEAGGGNCSTCRKCLRTLFTLELQNNLENYEQVFDMGVYRAHRWRFLLFILIEPTDHFNKEFLEYIKDTDFKFPLHIRLVGTLARPFGRLLRQADAAIRKAKRSRA